MSISIGIGIFIAYALGFVLSYWILAFIFAGVALLNIILLFTIREPAKTTSAYSRFKAKYWKKSQNEEVELPFNISTNSKKQSQSKIRSSWKVLLWQAPICFLLLAFQQLMGFNAIAFYAGPIFRAGGGDSWSFPPGLAASICIGISAVLSAILCALIVDLLGRKFLLFFGAIGMMIANIGVAVFFGIVKGFINNNDLNDTLSNKSSQCFFAPTTDPELGKQYSPLALVSVVLFIFAFGICWASTVFTVAAEMFADNTRKFGMGLGSAANWLGVVVTTTMLPIASAAIGEAIPFFIFSAVSLLAAIFVILFIPETRHRPLGQSAIDGFSIRKNVKEFYLSPTLYECRVRKS